MKKTLCLLLCFALCVPSLALAAGRTVRISGGYVEEYWTENGIQVSTPDYHEKTDAELLNVPMRRMYTAPTPETVTCGH